MTRSSNRYSPAALAGSYRSLIDACSKAIARLFLESRWRSVLLYALLFGGLFAAVSSRELLALSADESVRGSKAFVGLFRHSWVLLALFALLPWRRLLNIRAAASNLCFFACVVVTFGLRFHSFGWSFAMLGWAVTQMIIAYGAVWLLGRQPRPATGKWIFGGIAGPLLVAMAVFAISWSYNLPRGWMLYERFPFLALYWMLDRGYRSSTLAGTSFFFSGLHFFTPLPIPSSHWNRPSDRTVEARGLFDVALGSVFFLIAAEFARFTVNERAAIEETAGFLGYGFCRYLYYYFASCAWQALPVGAARLLGVSLDDYYRQPLLAANPWDRWRRWNTYFYAFTFQFIYFPLLKASRSAALAIAAVFFFTYLVHVDKLELLEMAHNPWIGDPETLRAGFLFFGLHGLAVWLSLKTRSWWPDENKALGWAGVAVVWVMMSFIHAFGP